jgi:hypothetical protein
VHADEDAKLRDVFLRRWCCADGAGGASPVAGARCHGKRVAEVGGERKEEAAAEESERDEDDEGDGEVGLLLEVRHCCRCRGLVLLVLTCLLLLL